MTGRALLLFSCLNAGMAVTIAAQSSVTIYSDGRVLHRRNLPVRLPAGVSTHRLELGQMDPGSLVALDEGVVVTGASYDAAVDESNTLRRSIGQRLTFAVRGATGTRDTVTAEVIGVDPERYRLGNGRIAFERPGTPLFPAELVLLDPSLSVAVRSDRARQGFGLGFFSSGASWSANYSVLLGSRNAARIAGYAAIQPGSLRLADAEVQLLAGNVGQAAKGRPMADGMVLRAATPTMEQAATAEQVGEAHLYTLPARLTFVPGVETTALLFDPATTSYERSYTVRGQLPYWGGLPQYGEEATEPVVVTYLLKRPLKTDFGDRPVPAGIVRLYERYGQGRAQLIGEANVGHSAAGQDLRVDAGSAFDLTARRTQTTYETRQEGRRTVATASYSVVVSNAKDSAVVVDVLEQRAGEWSVISSSIPPEKVSSTITRFRVRVPAKGDGTVSYRVRVVW